MSGASQGTQNDKIKWLGLPLYICPQVISPLTELTTGNSWCVSTTGEGNQRRRAGNLIDLFASTLTTVLILLVSTNEGK